MSADHAKGAKAIANGRNCLYCHAGEEADKGNLLVSGKKLEPKPIAGKVGLKKVTLQAAYDSEYLCLRASWPTKDPGISHEYAVYKDGKWENYASNRANPAVASGKMKASHKDRFTIMLGDGNSVPAFKNKGCWITCHNDLRYMPNEARKADVNAHPIPGATGMKKSSIRWPDRSRVPQSPSADPQREKPGEVRPGPCLEKRRSDGQIQQPGTERQHRRQRYRALPSRRFSADAQPGQQRRRYQCNAGKINAPAGAGIPQHRFSTSL